MAHTQADHYSPILTGYGILLYINGEPITGRYGKEIHHAATTPEISNYYKQKHKWTDEDMDTIDWDAFGRAQKNFTQLQQRNIHKLVHDWLPTGEQLDRRYHTTTQCPNCNHRDTRDHMLQCADNQQNIKAFLASHQKLLETWKTEPGLARLWISFLKQDNAVYTGTENNKPWTDTLIREQGKLGKNKMWLGFISQKWGDIQEAFHRREHHDQGYLGRSWATKVIHHVWKFYLSLWKKRTQAVHKGNIPPHRQELSRIIVQLYDQLRKVPNILEGLFKFEQATLLEKRTKYLMRWVQIAKEVPKKEGVRKYRRTRLGQDIRKYLKMAMKPPEPDDQLGTAGTKDGH